MGAVVVFGFLLVLVCAAFVFSLLLAVGFWCPGVVLPKPIELAKYPATHGSVGVLYNYLMAA